MSSIINLIKDRLKCPNRNTMVFNIFAERLYLRKGDYDPMNRNEVVEDIFTFSFYFIINICNFPANFVNDKKGRPNSGLT
jgi:hypothetical protein